MKLDRPPFKNYKPGEYPSKEDFDAVELKFDGWWLQLLLKGHKWEIYSRTGALKKEGKLKHPVKETLLHGEYLYGTEWAKDRDWLYDTCIVFDAVKMDGRSITHLDLYDRRLLLSDFLDRVRYEEIRNGVTLIDQWPIEAAKRVWDGYVLEEEFEGLVFKNSRSMWGDPMGRMKREVTMDYVCIGFEISDSDTYKGRGVASVLGGLHCKDGLVEVCRVGGLVDEQREEYFQNPGAYIGKVFEAQGKKISKRGSLRHPNFLRWRDDKPAEECTWEK